MESASSAFYGLIGFRIHLANFGTDVIPEHWRQLIGTVIVVRA
jgi:hypothetical protein